ncbi:MAG: DUF1593 domain-containing protein [Prevotella sp.]|nr:DUF1593 domain-containing protein [Prevotella sp.]
MKRTLLLAFLALIAIVADAKQKIAQKPRVLICTDIGGTDPDDNQSLTHLLMYNDQFDLEGLISSPSFGDGHKGEILRMIDVYRQDLPQLRRHIKGLMSPKSLRRLVKQGRMSEVPPCGYGEPTEGSEWIVRQARRPDKRPLYILVWGCLEDVAQALHDAPDIATRLRIHWIGGPNKKWGVNSYTYIVEHFPDLWMIENNTTYRGFIYDSKNHDQWNTGFYDRFICNTGHLGRNFADYYKGNPKLGDTPSLLYMMNGDPSQPERQSWAGRFVRCQRTPRTVFYGTTTTRDTAQICSIIEWQLTGPNRPDIAPDSACLILDIQRQQWKGYYQGNGHYVVRHSTYYIGTLSYSITSTVDGFAPISGEITIVNTWNTAPHATDYLVGRNWWTDSYAPADYWHGYAGAQTQRIVREEIMRDWAERWGWLKSP